jgi:hypothetical protein
MIVTLLKPHTDAGTDYAPGERSTWTRPPRSG